MAKKQRKTSSRAAIKPEAETVDRRRARTLARLAAILSQRLPKYRENPEDAASGNSFGLASAENDRDYLNCLARAQFLLDHAEGIQGQVHAADLFELEKQYSADSIANEFQRVGWKDLTSANSIRKLLKEIRDAMQRRTEDLMGCRIEETKYGRLGAESLSDMFRVVELTECGWPCRFGEIAFLCGQNYWFTDRLRIERKGLSNPPVPRFTPLPTPSFTPFLDAEVAMSELFRKVLKLDYPWRVANVNDYKHPAEVMVVRYPICPKCGRMGSRVRSGGATESTAQEKDIQVQTIRISRRILAMEATIILRFSPILCKEHGDIRIIAIDIPEIPK